MVSDEKSFEEDRSTQDAQRMNIRLVLPVLAIMRNRHVLQSGARYSGIAQVPGRSQLQWRWHALSLQISQWSCRL